MTKGMMISDKTVAYKFPFQFFYFIEGLNMTTVRYILIYTAFISICVAQNEVSKLVTIVQGPVRGYKASGSDVYEFFGIPYATAPNGTNKFKVNILSSCQINNNISSYL